ncbi:hypothetical protein CARUB_v10025555mg, partial [Capsella rubella]
MAVEATVSESGRNKNKNRIAEQMLESEHASSVKSVLEPLNALAGVRMWSPFHEESIQHLLADKVNRRR